MNHPVENLLIARLTGAHRARVLALCKPVKLTLGAVVCEGDQPLKYVYFPVRGMVSLVTRIDGEPKLEVGMVGCEGMLGAQAALDVTTEPLHAVVQGAGLAHRIECKAFQLELARNAPLLRTVHFYLYVLMNQLAVSAGCLRFHGITPRLARWLLMTQDRTYSPSFHVTHQFLSYMLGVRRVGITRAASVLQREGLITYRRGELTVLNRSGLEATACSCYRTTLQVYAEYLGKAARRARRPAGGTAPSTNVAA